MSNVVVIAFTHIIKSPYIFIFDFETISYLQRSCKLVQKNSHSHFIQVPRVVTFYHILHYLSLSLIRIPEPFSPNKV